MAQVKQAKRKMFLRSRKPSGSRASYPAMRLTQNKQKFYLATIPVEDVFPFSFVTRRQEDPLLGFQRNLSMLFGVGPS